MILTVNEAVYIDKLFWEHQRRQVSQTAGKFLWNKRNPTCINVTLFKKQKKLLV